jgi:protein-tyrosine-phosphatase
MNEPPRQRAPQAVLFMCGQNSVRSPVAAALLRQIGRRGLYVQSAGVRAGEPNPFAVAVMEEIGLDISGHQPWTVDELEDWEGFNFDLIITLAPEAHHRALEMTATLATEVEYWPTQDPVGTEGRRELQLDAYRAIRDELMRKIRARFAPPHAANG